MEVAIFVLGAGIPIIGVLSCMGCIYWASCTSSGQSRAPKICPLFYRSTSSPDSPDTPDSLVDEV